MHIVVTGGTGFIGRALCQSLSRSGHQVVVLTRSTGLTLPRVDAGLTTVVWKNREGGDWEQHIQTADAVVNLAGEPIAAGRWSQERKQVIMDSRVNTTRAIVRALSSASPKPRAFISASGVGYYGTSPHKLFDERDGPGSDFFADLCRSWEEAAYEAQSSTLRVACLRIGMVLERNGGALLKMVPPFRAFVGGPILPGTQWVSWIHRADLIGLIEWAIEHERITGPVNAVAPEAVTMKDFSKSLGRALSRPSWLPVPGFALQLAFGELASFMTTGQRVTPKVAVEEGYQFRYPHLDSALQSIFGDG